MAGRLADVERLVAALFPSVVRCCPADARVDVDLGTRQFAARYRIWTVRRPVARLTHLRRIVQEMAVE